MERFQMVLYWPNSRDELEPEPDGEWVRYADAMAERDAALAADRARIAAAVRWEMKLRPHFPKEPCEVVLARVLSLVEEKK